MLTKVQKWGNSLALRIPKAFALDAQHSIHLTIGIRGDCQPYFYT